MSKRKTTQNNPFNLPQCLLEEEIFLRLPVKSLLRFKSLSKQWNSVISSSHFTRLHVEYHRHNNLSPKTLLIDTNDSIYFSDFTSNDNRISLHHFDGKISTTFRPKLVQFVGSSQGLVCSYHGTEYFFVWNPSTNESRKITGYNPCHYRNIRRIDGTVTGTTIRGFGYVSSIDDFKIVQIHMIPSLATSENLKTSIFTLQGGDWKDIANDYRSLKLWRKCSIRPGTALVNETLHWLVDIGDNFRFVLAFNLAKEILLKRIQVPPISSTKVEAFLTVIDQCLSICNKNGSVIELWILRGFGWQKHFKVDLDMKIVGGKISEWNLFGCFEIDSSKIIVRLCDGRSYLVVDFGGNRSKLVALPPQLYLSFGISYFETLVRP